MDPITIFAAINAAITVANAAIKLGQGATPYWNALRDFVSGKTVGQISQADLEALQARVDALSAELQAPLPPE